MESIRTPGPSSNQVKKCKPPKKSKYKTKSSSVCLRLNPDFDPKDYATQTGRINIELNPKTVQFDELVNLLHPSFISDYLHKILSYLSSDSIELGFPSIAPYKEAFLLKIVQNNEYLKHSGKFNESAKVLAKQILHVIEANKNVYKWTHKFEAGNSTNILVYKKLYYFNKNNLMNAPSTVSKMTPIIQNTRSQTLSSSLEDLDLNKHDRQANPIPPSFKISTLNTLLKFLKDPKRTIFVFPEMPLPEAEFVHGIIDQNNNEPIGFGFKPLYASLFDAMEKLNSVYTISTSYLARTNSVAQVCVEKLTKRSAAQNNNNTTDHNTSIESAASKENPNYLQYSSRNKFAHKYASVIDNVQEDFIKSTLVDLLEFMGDNARASLEFEGCNPYEFRFLESLTSFVRRTRTWFMFSEDCAVLLDKIKRRRCDDWTLTNAVGKLCKKTNKRNITFYKFPSASNKQSLNKQKDTVSHENKDQTKDQAKILSVVVHRDGSKERSVTKKPIYQHNTSSSSDRATINSNSESIRKEPIVLNKNRSTSLGRERSRQPKTGISFQSAGAPVPTRDVPAKDVHARDVPTRDVPTKDVPATPETGRLTGRKGRLIEAMSTPLESDRAERMMRLMGWEGGPLGQRGEGITEPIMPALHLSPGAGLGHVKPIQRSPTEFKRPLLQKMLELLQTDQCDTIVYYSEVVTKKEYKFVRKMLEAFNQRRSDGDYKGLSFANELTPIVEKVMEAIIKNPILTIECQISINNKEIRLIKIQDPNLVIKKKNTSTSKKKTSKAEKYLAHRVILLEALNNFVTIRDPEKCYTFDFNLAKRDKVFICNIIKHVNKLIFYKLSSDTENILFDEILKKAKNCNLSIILYDHKIKLEKKDHQLPLLISKDIKNTVIYNNTKPNDTDKNQRKTQNDDAYNDSDDDVMIIEQKQEIIVISDSEDENDIEESHRNSDATDGAPKSLPNSTKDLYNLKTTSIAYAEFVINLVKPAETALKTTIVGDSDIIATLDKRDSIKPTNSDNSVRVVRQDVTDSAETTKLQNTDSIEPNFGHKSIVIIEGETETTNCDNNDTQVTPDATESTETTNHSNISELVTSDTDYLNDKDWENTSRDISLYSISNESLLLNILENENNSCDTKINIKVESELDKDITALEQVIFDCDTYFFDKSDIKQENNFKIVKAESIDATSYENLEINNNCDLDIKDSDIVEDSKDSQVNLSLKFSSDTEFYDSIEVYDTNSITSKRSRADSDDSIKSTKRYKVASKYHVFIAPDNPTEGIDLETVKKVQKVISTEIDKNTFLPLLKCHSLKNCGLVYGCHDEKTLVWLKNVLSVAGLGLKTNDIPFFESRNYKLKIKICSSDPVEKILQRIAMYNEGLMTQDWKVLNVHYDKDFVLITVEMDDDSYNYISMYSFSLFAGVDMAKFSMFWD